jgi:hypothetical protein
MTRIAYKRNEETAMYLIGKTTLNITLQIRLLHVEIK